ncbi:hypothetical protein SKAU_G00383200 [Synaphobranchus kaupii]|uniref:Uncharacterized protein n=1 Tax=Synaphobranchus kaupii TaxID=118154 RepID=A0A9Q1EE36_SYNKA|nr:hypothetical protein SKAU_G00383200 [Synaphobranchus kaupii]
MRNSDLRRDPREGSRNRLGRIHQLSREWGRPVLEPEGASECGAHTESGSIIKPLSAVQRTGHSARVSQEGWLSAPSSGCRPPRVTQYGHTDRQRRENGVSPYVCWTSGKQSLAVTLECSFPEIHETPSSTAGAPASPPPPSWPLAFPGARAAVQTRAPRRISGKLFYGMTPLLGPRYRRRHRGDYRG